ncbi:ThiF family adenylyltransferase [Ichthyobacterium seriolicida]|uniref:Molybdopterin-synthase adenylyltransferase n=1 Tax=Ichthyobacterium seriolicida TaxID=242600 RepID=A0A1J1DZL8_9FLAO|nr:ThiF family adenylyltransferase [Ichthyobacterium seriolicida]BAV94117.1 sulfur carrier protein adenylyltransferase thiF [Ichthyobacterium seriolicida]
MSRYDRHISLRDVGHKGQQKLFKAKVLIVGAGGLGCPILQYLAAAGVGKIGIIDHDRVEESNLQRQVLFGTDDIGKYKSHIAQKKLYNLNPTISIQSYADRLTRKNISHIIEGYDIIADGTDNFSTKYLLNDACVALDKTLVYASVNEFSGQVSVFNYKGGPNYRSLFAHPPQAFIPSCSESGVLGVLPGIIGSIQANEILKIILKIGVPLSGKLLTFNSLNNDISIFDICKTNIDEDVKTSSNNYFKGENYDLLNCDIHSLSSLEISLELAKKNPNTLFIDIRNLDELPRIKKIQVVEKNIESILDEINEIDDQRSLVLICQLGQRSLKAVNILRERGFKNCYSLQGGVLNNEV